MIGFFVLLGLLGWEPADTRRIKVDDPICQTDAQDGATPDRAPRHEREDGAP